MIEKTTQIQVETTEQPVDDEQGEQVQVWELAQQVEQLVEETNMETKQELEDQGINLMSRRSEFIPQYLRPLEP